MMSYLYISLLIIIAGMSNGIMDTLQFKYASSRLTALNPAFWNPAISWKRKYKDWDGNDKRPRFPFSTTALVFLTDAWHLFQFVMLSSFTAAIVIALYTDNQYSLLHAAVAFVIAKMLFSAGFHLIYTIMLPMNANLFGLLLVLLLPFGISAQTFSYTTPTDSTYVITEMVNDEDGSSTSTVSIEMSYDQAINYLYDTALDSDQRAVIKEIAAQEDRIRSNRAGRLIADINKDTTYQQIINNQISNHFDGTYIFRNGTNASRIQIDNRRFEHGATRIILIPINHFEFKLRKLEEQDVLFQRVKDNVYRAITEKERYILRKL